MELVIHETPEATAASAADRVADLVGGSEGTFTLGFAGGSTPRATYRAMRGRVSTWERVEGWLSDERWIPHDHSRSNGLMVAEALTNHVPASLHRPPWSELLGPEDSAAHYEAKLRSLHPHGRPDLILLGMGDDGHTASLFPGTPALGEQKRWYVANHVPGQPDERLTATYPLLWSAHMLIVLVVGENKAVALKSSFERKTPAGLIGDGDSTVEWHVDTAAASLLS
jgi:6-phosphogluconolactonase